jgi:2-polyprenyl-3-methyl-5-hydroxy-6-metoxy-1,4-benzoquinol methylase
MSGETLNNVETTVEVVEHVAEVTEKLAANAANSLPENGPLQKVAVEIEYIAEVVDKDAHKVEAVIKKIEDVSDKIDAAVEPVIEALEKDFKPNPTSSTGPDAKE